MIPFLYGDPVEVSEKARALVQTTKLHDTLDYLMKVYEILTVYGLEKYLVLDLGLINHMDYYSGVIFQGFVGKFGKPVLMGGRYDKLGNEFGSNLPAIGFACEVESLVEASDDDNQSRRYPIDIVITYDDNSLKNSIMIANELRERSYYVLTSPSQKSTTNQQQSNHQISIIAGEMTFHYKDAHVLFSTIAELLALITESKGRV